MKELWCENCCSGVQGHDTRHCPHSTAERYRVIEAERDLLAQKRRALSREIEQLTALLGRLYR